MRKWNGILTAAIMALFLLHGILGAFQLLGAGNVISKAVAWTMTGLVAVHAVIGLILTGRTLRTLRASGAGYFRKNLVFWAGRLSGAAIMILLLFHMTAFADRSAPVYRLIPFTAARLAAQLLLVLSIALHVLINVRPSLITFGVRNTRKIAADIVFVLSVILLFAAFAMVVYYLRWNRI